MSSLLNTQVFFVNKSQLELNTQTLRQAIETIFEIQDKIESQAFKLVFPKTLKTLYFDAPLFKQFLNNNISQSELVTRTQCDGLFRNTTKLVLSDQSIIDEGALWMKQGNNLVLADDDEEFISSALDYKAFLEV
jgi:hypothetical protein